MSFIKGKGGLKDNQSCAQNAALLLIHDEISVNSYYLCVFYKSGYYHQLMRIEVMKNEILPGNHNKGLKSTNRQAQIYSLSRFCDRARRRKSDD